MGASNIISFVMLFFIIIIIISTTLMIYSTIIQSNDAINEKQEKNLLMSQTSIKITNITYTYLEEDKDLIEIFVKNVGSKKLNFDETEVYINGIRIPRDTNNRTINIINENTINPQLWDPNEIIRIDVFMDILDENNYAIVSTEYGIKHNYFFSN
ncbi:MAG: hypothetical protein ACLFPJ_03090 [Candidatus Woesearchaeota archaeon]